MEWLKRHNKLQPARPVLQPGYAASKIEDFYIFVIVDCVIKANDKNAVKQDSVFHVHGYDTHINTHTRSGKELL